jgi:hypothetical protein
MSIPGRAYRFINKRGVLGGIDMPGKPNGLTEVLTPNTLRNRNEIGDYEAVHLLSGMRIMRFDTWENAMGFRREFANFYLLPKYGREWEKFPMGRLKPHKDGSQSLADALGIGHEDPKEEAWLVVPENRYPEVREYLNVFYGL